VETKYGEWTVIKELPRVNNMRFVLCRCSCGKEKGVYLKHLKSGASKSCGHNQPKIMSKIGSMNIKHGDCAKGSKTKRLYGIWKGMINRCYDTKNHAYNNYGGRNIKICDEWLGDRKKFYKWAFLNGYQDNLTIDRIDNNGNYEPSNCRWATAKEQANNRRYTHRRLITYNGETLSVTEWSKKTGINKSTLSCRVNKMGLTDPKLIFMEVTYGYHKKISNK
jgi:hypothetical protein